MNIRSILLLFVATMALLGTSCTDTKSYAQLLDDERKATNSYLSTKRVISEIPADSIFETGVDAPFYKLDEDGNIYMQVLKAGDRKNNKAEVNQLIYFRFMRISLLDWANGDNPTPDGNADDVGVNSMSFRYLNYELSSSVQFGTGIQTPLHFLGIDCEVNLIIKSQYGFTSEIANVTPFMYTIRYFKSQV